MPGSLTCFDGPLTLQKSRCIERAALGPHFYRTVKNSTQNAPNLTICELENKKKFWGGDTDPSLFRSPIRRGTPSPNLLSFVSGIVYRKQNIM